MCACLWNIRDFDLFTSQLNEHRQCGMRMGCSDWPIGLFIPVLLHCTCFAGRFFSRLLKLTNAQEFTLFCFCVESSWNFKFGFVCRQEKTLIFWVWTSLNLEKGDQLIQRVLPKNPGFWPWKQESAYTQSWLIHRDLQYSDCPTSRGL